MYELEVAAYEDRLEEFATNYEKDFGVTFGERPNVTVANAKDYRAYLEDLGRESGMDLGSPEELDSMAQSMYYQAMGMYDDINHQVLISDYVMGNGDDVDQGMLDYVLAHELVHAYQHNHGTTMSTVELSKEIDKRFGSGGDLQSQLLSATWSFPVMAIAEGQAEYMSINMLKEHAADNERNAAAWEAASGKYQEGYVGAKDYYRENIEALVEVEERAKRGEVGFMDMFILGQIKMAQYVLGIGYIEDVVERDGTTMDELLDNGPETLSDFLK